MRFIFVILVCLLWAISILAINVGWITGIAGLIIGLADLGSWACFKFGAALFAGGIGTFVVTILFCAISGFQRPSFSLRRRRVA